MSFSTSNPFAQNTPQKGEAKGFFQALIDPSFDDFIALEFIIASVKTAENTTKLVYKD